jgi:hypothetical protein
MSTLSLRQKFVLGIAALLAAGLFYQVFTGRLALFQTSARFDLGLEPNRTIYRQVPLWLVPGSRVSQEFTADYPGLYRVSLFLTRRPGTLDPVTVRFRLKQTCASTDDVRQVTATVNPAAWPGDGFYPFTFAPLDQSAGQTYCLLVEPAANTSAEPALGVWASRADVVAGGAAGYQAPPKPEPVATALPAAQNPVSPELLNYRVFLPVVLSNPGALIPANFDVGFQLHYAGRWGPVLRTFAGRLTAHKPFVWTWPGWYGLLALLGGALLIRLFRSDPG